MIPDAYLHDLAFTLRDRDAQRKVAKQMMQKGLAEFAEEHWQPARKQLKGST